MNGVTLTVTGLLDIPVGGLNSLVFVTPIGKAGDWLQMDGAYLEILALTKPGTDLGALTERLNATVRPRGLEASNWTQSSAVYVMVQVVEGIINIIAVMFILLGSAVVINTTMMVVFERRREIGALGAMGMNAFELVRLFLIEAIILAVLGAGGGTLIGVALASLFAWTGLDLSVLMAGINIEFPTVLHPVLDLRSVAGSLLMIIALSSLASLLPSWMAARIQPVDALRD
jgi:putative ABC transport system permease protein